MLRKKKYIFYKNRGDILKFIYIACRVQYELTTSGI